MAGERETSFGMTELDGFEKESLEALVILDRFEMSSDSDEDSREASSRVIQRNGSEELTAAVPPTPHSKGSRGSSRTPLSPAPATPASSRGRAKRVRQSPTEADDRIPSTPHSHSHSQHTAEGSLAGYASFLRDWSARGDDDEEGDYDGDTKDHMDQPSAVTDGDGLSATDYGTVPPEDLMLVRGTDIHIHTAAKAFQDFLRNFVSLQHCDAAKRRRSINNDEHDEDSEASDAVTASRPYYMDQLRDILLGLKTDKPQDQAIRSSTALPSTAFIDINTQHLFDYSTQCQKLYHQLVSSPTEVVPLMDIIVAQELDILLQQLHDEKSKSNQPQRYASLHPLGTPVPRTQVRPFYLKDLSYMRSLDPNTIDNLLTIRGMIVRSSPIIPDLKVAHFQCSICGQVNAVTLHNGRIQEPTLCSSCNIRDTYQLIHNRCIFADKQMVRMQETPDEVPAGETPASIVLFAFDDMVDAVRPGDRVEVTGILRAQPRRVHPRISKVKSVYKTYLDVIHFRRISGNKDRLVDNINSMDMVDSDDDSTTGNTNIHTTSQTPVDTTARGKGITIEHIGATLSTERVALLQQLARDPEIYDRLVQSLAPSIWGMDDVKKGVLCMLFGGNSKRVKKGTAARVAARNQPVDTMEEETSNPEELMESSEPTDETKLYKRGDINILLCGDPGTSKSQLLSYVHALSPRGVYTSGKGSSAVGLTASIVRDPETRELVLESGALVLSDLGICCIDEFDKMSDTTRAILHEAMEQQTVSIAKAGIIATLNSRTSILASANPVESRYNPQLSVVENIKLPPTLLSRFDLIYLILDAPNVETDRRLAQHLVGLYYDTPNVVQPPLDQNLLRDFIAYARENIHPELSDLATRDLISAYLDMRSLGGSGANGSRTISATPRQLESLIRLSEALAKMRYSTVVSRADVKEAVRLMRIATQAAATDPRTGRIDMDMITTGRTTVNREQEELLNASLREMFTTKRGNRMAVSDVRRELADMMNVATVIQDELVDAIRRVEADGLIQFNERNQTIFVRAGMI